MRNSSKCLVRGGSEPRESRSDKGGGAPWLVETTPVKHCPAQPLPPPAAAAGRCAGGCPWSNPTRGRGWSGPLPNTARPASRGRKDPS